MTFKPDLLTQLRLVSGMPPPIPEYRFHATRRWRFDLAWVPWKLALELEGGVYTGGRHVRGKGFEADCRKYNEAAVAGWRLLRVTPRMVASGEAVTLIRRALGLEDVS